MGLARALSGPTVGAHSAPTEPITGFKGQAWGPKSTQRGRIGRKGKEGREKGRD